VLCAVSFDIVIPFHVVIVTKLPPSIDSYCFYFQGGQYLTDVLDFAYIRQFYLAPEDGT